MSALFPPKSPFNIDGANYNWPELSDVDRDLFDWPESRPDMDEWLALNRDDPIQRPNSEPTIQAYIHANQHRNLFPPAAGDLVPGLCSQTAAE
ncbi:hypothetical protein DFS33DRAFT_1378664 [Desarmillaria ectypa]|nr:hypothetical protein DFS33DRAFT_1378664 [Desarmillaria ectypa]